MLEVVSSTYHRKTPESPSARSASGDKSSNRAWNSEPRGSSYKCRKSQDSSASKRFKSMTADDVTKNFNINRNEITLTIVSKSSSTDSLKEEEREKGLNKDTNNNSVDIYTLPKQPVSTKSKPITLDFSNEICEIIDDSKVLKPTAVKNESFENKWQKSTYAACIEKINQSEVSVFKTSSKSQSPRSEHKEERITGNDPEHLVAIEFVSCDKIEDSKMPEFEAPAQDPCDVSDAQPEDEGYACDDFWRGPGKQSRKMAQAMEMLKAAKSFSPPRITTSTIIPTENWDDADAIQSYPTQQLSTSWDDHRSDNWNNDPYEFQDHAPPVIPDHSHFSPDSAYGSIGDYEMSHYMIGFPNPPGENRCWLNATLHSLFATLFTLPIASDMQVLNSGRCSKLTRMLIEMEEYWRKGAFEKHKIYHMVKNFKEDLGSLDSTYPSERQQDVSEFLMIFLNHLKSDFEKVLSKKSITQGIENATENRQESPRKSKTSQDSSKRLPLASIFPINKKLRRSSTSDSPTKIVQEELVEEAEEAMETSISEIDMIDPIDKYFLLNMIEDYACKGCSKHRQSSVANLMLYVDLPSEKKSDEKAEAEIVEEKPVKLSEAIDKTFESEERSLVCESCKHDTHDMKIYFKEYPKIMMVQINRYGRSESGLMTKISTPVKIPENLSLPHVLEGESQGTKSYEPICIISHVGSSVDYGHYTSYVKHEDHWFHYNDQVVSPMTSKEALKAAETTAYIIFYADSEILVKDTANCFSS